MPHTASTRSVVPGASVPQPNVKRRRGSSASSPIYVSSIRADGRQATAAAALLCPSCAAGTKSMSSTTTTSPEARQRLFDALEKGERSAAAMTKPIASPEQLTEVQLTRCFDILHACGRATDTQATLATTRHSIDGFLEAVFQDWSSETSDELLRPELEFMVDAEVVAGRICVSPSKHITISDCTSARPPCTVEVAASAAYSSNPAMLKQELLTTDPFTRQPEATCLLGRGDVRWVSTDWKATLRQTLLSKVVAKAAKFNKHLAIWKARRLIVAWSRGCVEVGVGDAEDEEAGFVGREQAELALMCFGG
ncbi:hypothetical protein JDV02_002997 [Purpureocillium takamizusanense]|uniref:Uncharacterized protein n=1 Tax=Purpureocillium takamizusanense TaxID=2060973 RepID=A0A9Q8QC92_9HYPO|nr:uncharacterized protein JDV02_002997 [Purpureocillium takamizusanense]UNI16571.1 hypothetical protein JDV02_002997 [Purpureocillium takamizusanense]